MKRIFFNDERNVLVVEPVSDVYPARSLWANTDGQKVQVWLGQTTERIISTIYTELADRDGNGFANAAAAEAYLLAEFAKEKSSEDPGDLVALFNNEL